MCLVLKWDQWRSLILCYVQYQGPMSVQHDINVLLLFLNKTLIIVPSTPAHWPDDVTRSLKKSQQCLKRLSHHDPSASNRPWYSESDLGHGKLERKSYFWSQSGRLGRWCWHGGHYRKGCTRPLTCESLRFTNFTCWLNLKH